MSLTYPIADNGTDALTAPLGHARTKSSARREVGRSVTFETEWLKPDPAQLEAWQGDIQTAISNGSAQAYESDKGQPVIAINYWKPQAQAPVEVKRPMAGESTEKRDDHADDLYFRKGRTKTEKKAQVDPNQLDLFGSPKKPE